MTPPTLARAADALRLRGAAPIYRWFVPGRIEVLGKHTDYAGGRSLTCAVPRGFVFAAAPRSDASVRLIRAHTGDTEVFPLDPDLPARRGHWSDYARTVARRAARDFGARRGVDVALASDLPSAAGLSSSSAFVVGCFLVLAEANGLAAHAGYRAHLDTRERLADYLGAVESGRPFAGFAPDAGVGTFGGSEDHTAILCSAAGRLGLYAYAPTRRLDTVALPPGLTFAVGVSGVTAAKTGAARAAYNRAALLAGEIIRLWNAATARDAPHLAALLDTPGFDPDRLHALLRRSESRFDAAALITRFDQFRAEHAHLLPTAADALKRGDLAKFGEVVDHSQRLAETHLGNQVPETVFLAASARKLGALAASAFGAGFGGSVWALVEVERASAFLDDWHRRYAEAFPGRGGARFFTAAPGPAAYRVTRDGGGDS